MREQHRCRFPWCICSRFGLFLEVSHQEHKGMGGDPTGERSLPAKMVLICNWRHKESQYSIDKERLRWRELQEGAGADGPIAWDIRADQQWIELARESRPGLYLPSENGQQELLLAILEQELIGRFG